MAYSWTAGEEVTAAKLNATGSAPAVIHWAGKRFSDLNDADGAFVFTKSNQNFFESGTSSNMEFYDRLAADGLLGRDLTANRSGLSITPTVMCRYTDGGTDYMVAFAAGGTSAYRYDEDGQNETAMSFSGTAVTTGAYRIAWDPNDSRLYVMDGANKAATSVKRYTISGTTLTYVDTITLSAAPGNAGCTGMWVGQNYLCISDDNAGNDTVSIHRYGKDSGTQQDDTTFFSNIQHTGFAVDVDNNLYIGVETNTSTDGTLLFTLANIDTP